MTPSQPSPRSDLLAFVLVAAAFAVVLVLTSC